jgi:hypothetical protein
MVLEPASVLQTIPKIRDLARIGFSAECLPAPLT